MEAFYCFCLFYNSLVLDAAVYSWKVNLQVLMFWVNCSFKVRILKSWSKYFSNVTQIFFFYFISKPLFHREPVIQRKGHESSFNKFRCDQTGKNSQLLLIQIEYFKSILFAGRVNKCNFQRFLLSK